MLSTRVWLVLPDSITLQWGSLIDESSPLQSVGAPAIDRVWALPPCSTLGCSLSLSEFGRSRHRVWPLPGPPSLGALRWWWPVFKCTCALGCQYYHTLWVLCSASGLDTRAWLSKTGSGIVEAGCCDTSQHRWQSLNEDWAFIVDSWPHAH